MCVKLLIAGASLQGVSGSILLSQPLQQMHAWSP
jgi:hypothetical protein